jgi:hypothetical protein
MNNLTAFLLLTAVFFGIPLLMTGVAAAFISKNKQLITLCWILFLPFTAIVYVAQPPEHQGGAQ